MHPTCRAVNEECFDFDECGDYSTWFARKPVFQRECTPRAGGARAGEPGCATASAAVPPGCRPCPLTPLTTRPPMHVPTATHPAIHLDRPAVEYCQAGMQAPACFCAKAKAAGLNTIIKPMNLNASGVSCTQYCA